MSKTSHPEKAIISSWENYHPLRKRHCILFGKCPSFRIFFRQCTFFKK